jgi:CBS domain-containing protein
MAKLARDVMTQDPACCSPSTTLDQVAKMMVENNCGEIPIVDRSNHPSESSPIGISSVGLSPRERTRPARPPTRA